MPRGRPHASWLRQVESYLKNTGMAGLASAWAMARRRPKVYRRKVDAATRCSIVCTRTRPDRYTKTEVMADGQVLSVVVIQLTFPE